MVQFSLYYVSPYCLYFLFGFSDDTWSVCLNLWYRFHPAQSTQASQPHKTKLQEFVQAIDRNQE